MKNIFALLSLIFLSYAAAAQSTGPTVLQRDHNVVSGVGNNSGFGLKGGVNFANLRGSDRDLRGSLSTLTSFHAGAYAQFSLSDAFSLQPEVLYSRKGFERADSAFRYDYIEVPVLAVFNITETISLHAGPQVGVMLAAKEGGREINMEPLNTFEYGVVGGAEARFDRFRLGARYNLGLADIRKENNLGARINEDIKNAVFQVYLGIGF